MINKVLVFGAVVIMLAGCSNKNYYESLQADKSDCNDLPIQHREACFQKVEGLMTFDEYNKERKKL